MCEPYLAICLASETIVEVATPTVVPTIGIKGLGIILGQPPY